MTEETPAQEDSEKGSESTTVESAQNEAKPNVSFLIETAKKVILNPLGFFREMPKTGGLLDPLVFVVAVALASGALTAVLALLKPSALAAIIYMPIAAVIGSFIGGGIMFIIWRLMGSGHNFEVAYRCSAYSFAIHPIVVVLGLIPYIGTSIGLVWGLYLVVIASTEVHNLKAKTAWIVFGTLTAISVVTSIRAERFRRNVEDHMPNFIMNNRIPSEDMTPEEAGRAVGEFLRGMQEATENKGSE